MNTFKQISLMTIITIGSLIALSSEGISQEQRPPVSQPAPVDPFGNPPNQTSTDQSSAAQQSADQTSQPAPVDPFGNPPNQNTKTGANGSQNIEPLPNNNESQNPEVNPARNPTSELPNSTAPNRDPFSVTPKMLQRAARGTPGLGNQPTRASLPNLEMIGFAEDGVNPAIALVKISNNEVLFVRENDSLYLPSAKAYLKLKVAKIDRMGVLVEIEDSGETVWIH